MNRRITILLLSIIFCGIFCRTTYAQEADYIEIPLLEELNADLLSKTKELKNSDENKIKIDVESLGLDDVDSEKKIDKKPEINKEEKTIIKKEKSESEKKAIKEKKISKEKIKSQKLAKKRRERAKKRRKAREEAKLKKLDRLRKEYLIKIDQKDSNSQIFSLDDKQKIIPRRKELHKYTTDTPPALPILNRYRTRDNIHIPTIRNDKEKRELLFEAVASGNAAFFNSAYKGVDNPNVKNRNGDTVITFAILTQKHATLAAALAKGADPNMPNSLGYTPINMAIELLDAKSLELLANNGANLKHFDSFGRTYLMHASRVGFLPAVELMVKNGVNVNAMDDDGFTALTIAYKHKKEVIVKYLLVHGAKTWIEKPYEPDKQYLIKELKNRW